MAQNGVDVSNLVANAGTVTFDVGWKNTGMPALWSDSVWVFVDYNDAGVMKRLPLSPGATLTATSAPGAGVVKQLPGNNKGVWVIGNARHTGSFSATVQLLTASTGGGRPLHGACAYASNYPPVGKHISAANISFTGMPPYEVVLTDESGGTISQISNGNYYLPGNYMIQSFSDNTGAPGTYTCTLPTITAQPTASSTVCFGDTVRLSVAANNAMTWQWKKNGVNVTDGVGGTTANYTTAALTGNATYTVVARNGFSACSATSSNALVTVYTAVSPGTITTAVTMTPAGVAPGVTVQSASPASGGSGNFTYSWIRSGMSAATFTGNNATYALNTDAANYSTLGKYYFNRYVKDEFCKIIVAATGTYTLKVYTPGVNQPQGSCTFTQPALVGTFADFDKNYSASTYVTLTDERDGKNYPVVKLNGRWIMARNLNYQKDLTWQDHSYHPEMASGGAVAALIGHFWCPGGENATNVDISTRASCDVWGALYSWETAMSFDGTGRWQETMIYNTGAANAANSQFNHGTTRRGYTGGPGICPPDWHVPTDHEWGIVLDGMESGGGTAHQNASGAGWYGINAGSRGKSKCTCTSVACSNDTDTGWNFSDNSVKGIDVYGFRVLPAGYRFGNGYTFKARGTSARFWSSSAYSSSGAWYRAFSYSEVDTNRHNDHRSFGYSIRCIRDL